MSKRRFIQELAARGIVSDAAKAAGVGRRTAYDWRRSDPEFAAAWNEAEAQSVDALAHEAWRRGVEGYDRPIYQKGALVGHERTYSDSLLSTLLRLKLPPVAHQVEVTGQLDHAHAHAVGSSDELRAALSRIAEGEDDGAGGTRAPEPGPGAPGDNGGDTDDRTGGG